MRFPIGTQRKGIPRSQYQKTSSSNGYFFRYWISFLARLAFCFLLFSRVGISLNSDRTSSYSTAKERYVVLDCKGEEGISLFTGAKDTLTSGKLGLIVGLTFSSLLNPDISYSRVIIFSFSIPSSRGERVKTLILIRERTDLVRSVLFTAAKQPTH